MDQDLDESKSLLGVNYDTRTLPSQQSDKACQVKLTPPLLGKRFAGGRQMKDYEEELSKLKMENFSLKARIYFNEQNLPNDTSDTPQLRNIYLKLKAEHEETIKDLSMKEDLLLATYKVLESQKTQIKTMNESYKQEVRELMDKIQFLEEIKEPEEGLQHEVKELRFSLDKIKANEQAKLEKNSERFEALENTIKEIKEITLKKAELQNLKEMDQKLPPDNEKYKQTVKYLNNKTKKLELLLIEKAKENQELVDTNHDLENQVSKLANINTKYALEVQKLTSIQDDKPPVTSE